MRTALLVLALIAATAAGQPPEPGRLPAGVVTATTPERGDPAAPLPRREVRVPLETSRLASVQSSSGSWQVAAGRTVFHDFGPDWAAADEAKRLMRETAATEWGKVGPVEYGLTAGKAAVGTPRPRRSAPIDADTLRAEQLQGVWVVRDEAAVVANFGPAKADAEFAAAVIRRYGFNRAGFVGHPAPRLTVVYHDPLPAGRPADAGPLAQAAVEQSLTRTGVPVPGTDAFVGDRLRIDPRKVEVRREKSDFVLAHGGDVLARFGPNEWAARDALKAVQDGRFTEACTVGGATFFLVNGRPPARVGFGVQSTKFDPAEAKVRPADGGHAVLDKTGRRLAPATTQAEAEALLKVIRGYGFDTACQTGPSPRASLRFFAKTGP